MSQIYAVVRPVVHRVAAGVRSQRFATVTATNNKLPLDGVKVLDLTRVLAGVSSFSPTILLKILQRKLTVILPLAVLYADSWGFGVSDYYLLLLVDFNADLSMLEPRF